MVDVKHQILTRRGIDVERWDQRCTDDLAGKLKAILADAAGPGEEAATFVSLEELVHDDAGMLK